MVGSLSRRMTSDEGSLTVWSVLLIVNIVSTLTNPPTETFSVIVSLFATIASAAWFGVYCSKVARARKASRTSE